MNNYAAAARPVRIALVADTHLGKDRPVFHERFDKVIEAVNAAKVDMVLIAGDLTHSAMPEEIEDFKAQIARISAPVRYVYGNHDVGAKHFAGNEDSVTAERVARFEESLGPSYWKDTVSAIRVVGVNGSLFGSGLQWEPGSMGVHRAGDGPLHWNVSSADPLSAIP